MPDHHTYDYAVVRVVPRVERGEFINAGVILSCAAQNFLRAQIELDAARLLSLDPGADVDALRSALEAIPLICDGGPAAGPIGMLSVRERFHWLVAPRSASIQTSAVHTGRCSDLAQTLEHLMTRMVRVPAPRGAVEAMPRPPSTSS